MNKRLSYALALAFVGSFAMVACSDDDSSGPEDTGGSAGKAGSSAGSKTGGSTSGGTSNKAGTSAGGTAGSGTAEAGAGGVAEGGAGGVAEGGAGGAGEGGAGPLGGADTGGAGGAGGEGGTGELVYACGSDTQYKILCSAKMAADCPDPTECSDCITLLGDDYDSAMTECATCDALVDDYYQCGVDAYQSGDAEAGMQCIDGFGADFSDACFAIFDEYFACATYLNDHTCPATWPVQ